eukprot:3487881-Rhodomonas_salina.3
MQVSPPTGAMHWDARSPRIRNTRLGCPRRIVRVEASSGLEPHNNRACRRQSIFVLRLQLRDMLPRPSNSPLRPREFPPRPHVPTTPPRTEIGGTDRGSLRPLGCRGRSRGSAPPLGARAAAHRTPNRPRRPQNTDKTSIGQRRGSAL